MARRGGPNDPFECYGSEYSSLFKVVVDGTPGSMTDDERVRIANGEAQEAIVADLQWVSPYTGATYIAVGPDGKERGDPGWQICKYRKLREKDWFIAQEGEVLYGPLDTKRHALHQIREKRGKTVEAGHYTAGGYDIFTRDMAEKVIGRIL